MILIYPLKVKRSEMKNFACPFIGETALKLGQKIMRRDKPGTLCKIDRHFNRQMKRL